MPNFTATNSLNGLQTTTLFIAPLAGVYFVNGQLTLPVLRDAPNNVEALLSPSPYRTASQVVATVFDGATPVYTGIAGATGFQTNVTCAAGDVVTVSLTSTAAIDTAINAVRGVVSSGQSF